MQTPYDNYIDVKNDSVEKRILYFRDCALDMFKKGDYANRVDEAIKYLLQYEMYEAVQGILMAIQYLKNAGK